MLIEVEDEIETTVPNYRPIAYLHMLEYSHVTTEEKSNTSPWEQQKKLFKGAITASGLYFIYQDRKQWRQGTNAHTRVGCKIHRLTKILLSNVTKLRFNMFPLALHTFLPWLDPIGEEDFILSVKKFINNRYEVIKVFPLFWIECCFTLGNKW